MIEGKYPVILKAAVEGAPRAAGRLPTTLTNCRAYHPPGDNCQFCKSLRLHGDAHLAVRQVPFLGWWDSPPTRPKWPARIVA